MADMKTHTTGSRRTGTGFPNAPRPSRKSGPVKPMPIHRNHPRRPIRIPGRG